jgi:hypothetical protein
VLLLAFRRLICPLLLLALFAGGPVSLFLQLPGDGRAMSMTDEQMSGKYCKDCDEAAPSSVCDAVCAALPAIEAAAVALDPASSGVAWGLSFETGSTHFISPDTSPPRA